MELTTLDNVSAMKAVRRAETVRSVACNAASPIWTLNLVSYPHPILQCSTL